jgi:hypothetical protein
VSFASPTTTRVRSEAVPQSAAHAATHPSHGIVDIGSHDAAAVKDAAPSLTLSVAGDLLTVVTDGDCDVFTNAPEAQLADVGAAGKPPRYTVPKNLGRRRLVAADDTGHWTDLPRDLRWLRLAHGVPAGPGATIELACTDGSVVAARTHRAGDDVVRHARDRFTPTVLGLEGTV